MTVETFEPNSLEEGAAVDNAEEKGAPFLRVMLGIALFSAAVYVIIHNLKQEQPKATAADAAEVGQE